MSVEVAEKFANEAQHPGALRDALERAADGDPKEALARLLSIASAHGYSFSGEDYYNSSRSRAVARGLPWPPERNGAMSAYPQYGFPYSTFPPIPPPMPT